MHQEYTQGNRVNNPIVGAKLSVICGRYPVDPVKTIPAQSPWDPDFPFLVELS